MSDDTDIPEEAEDEGPKGLPEGVSPITIEEEMKRSYLDYAMSVIVSRAIPDAVSYTHLTLPTILRV